MRSMSNKNREHQHDEDGSPANPHGVTDPAQLDTILGTAPDFVRNKLGDCLDDPTRAFIASSPLVFVATSDRDGRLDVSPKGDAAGFVHAVDATTLLIPERKGNNLAFGPRNIIETGRIGLIFLVPGQRETLRVNGSASLSIDPVLLARLEAHGRPALLCTRVEIEECFFHCGKAIIRSNLWHPATWPETSESPMVTQTVDALGGDPQLADVIANTIEQNYIDDLY